MVMLVISCWLLVILFRPSGGFFIFFTKTRRSRQVEAHWPRLRRAVHCAWLCFDGKSTKPAECGLSRSLLTKAGCPCGPCVSILAVGWLVIGCWLLVILFRPS